MYRILFTQSENPVSLQLSTASALSVASLANIIKSGFMSLMSVPIVDSSRAESVQCLGVFAGNGTLVSTVFVSSDCKTSVQRVLCSFLVDIFGRRISVHVRGTCSTTTVSFFISAKIFLKS